jgi:hypothetical protein
MNRFIVFLTAAMTLSHAVLGCDAHAAHGEGCSDKIQASHSDHDQHEPIDGQTPSHEDECCRFTCKWLSPDVVGELAFELLGYSTILDEHQTANSRSSHALLSLDSPADFLFALPVRSHLAMSILLI